MVSKFVQIFLFVLGIFKEGFKLKTQIEYNHRWDVIMVIFWVGEVSLGQKSASY